MNMISIAVTKGGETQHFRINGDKAQITLMDDIVVEVQIWTSEEGELQDGESDVDMSVSEEEDESDIEMDESTPINKMQEQLEVIASNDLASLRAFVGQRFPDIKINRQSTVLSLGMELFKQFYQTASEREIRRYTPDIRDLLNRLVPNLNSLSSKFNVIRGILSSRFGADHKLYKWHKKNGGLTREQHNERTQTADMNRDNRLSNQVQITEQQVREIMNRFTASDDLFDRVLAIQIATGARLIEALRVSTFFKVPYNQSWIKVRGIAKKGEEGATVEMDRPLFGISADELLELVTGVRKDLKRRYRNYDKMSNEELTKKVDSLVNSRVKELGLPGIESSHMMRKLFANITHAELPEENRDAINKQHHIRTVLGHKRNETSASYSHVNIRGNRIENSAALDQKLNEIDRTDARQDRDIDKLKKDVSEGPKLGEMSARAYDIINLLGQPVRIVVDYPKSSGKERALYILRLLENNLANITDSLLTEFGVGKSTISSIKASKMAAKQRAVEEATRIGR